MTSTPLHLILTPRASILPQRRGLKPNSFVMLILTLHTLSADEAEGGREDRGRKGWMEGDR